MTNQRRSSNDERIKAGFARFFGLRHLIIPSSFDIRHWFHSSFFSLMHEKFVSVRITKLRHPADRRLRLIHIERHPALLELADRRVNVVHFKGDRRTLPKWLPGRMRADPYGRRP